MPRPHPRYEVRRADLRLPVPRFSVPRFSAAGALSIGLLLAGGGEAHAGATEPSRDLRSASYCSLQANAAGFYDTEAAIACRREEYTAAARAREVVVPPDIDAYCDSLAAEGDPIGPFSWRAYLDCVDSLQP